MLSQCSRLYTVFINPYVKRGKINALFLSLSLSHLLPEIIKFELSSVFWNKSSSKLWIFIFSLTPVRIPILFIYFSLSLCDCASVCECLRTQESGCSNLWFKINFPCKKTWTRQMSHSHQICHCYKRCLKAVLLILYCCLQIIRFGSFTLPTIRWNKW